MREFIISIYSQKGGAPLAERLVWGRNRGAAIKAAYELLTRFERGARFQIEG